MTVVRQMDDAHGSNSAEFKAALRRALPGLPDLPAVQEGEPLIWTRVTLPSVPGAAKGDPLRPFGAFRFRSPLSGPGDLYWAFCCDEPGIEWYIIPDNGTMRGFEDFSRDFRVDIPGVALPRDNVLVLQELVGGAIQPDQDYIIWMAAPEGRASLDVQCALRLVPAGTSPSEPRLDALARRLDLKYGDRPFPDTPEGYREACESLSDLHNSDVTRVDITRRILSPVVGHIPVAKVADAGPAEWTRVTPQAPMFATLRFRSPLDVPARLVACYVVSNEQLRWGLISPEGFSAESFNVALEVNCPLPGTANPDQNLAMFAALPDDLIEPGQDYLLWFSPTRGILADFDIALGLVPESQDALPETAVDIARTLGLSIPTTPTPERIAAAFRRCQGLIQEGREETRSFARLLDFVGPWLPPLVDADKPLPWQTISPGPDDPQFAAFQVDLKERSQVVCAVACPLTKDLKWGFFDSTGIWANAVSKEMVRHDVRLEGVSLPDHNTLLLETGVSEVPAGRTSQRLVFYVSGFNDTPLKAWLKSTLFPFPTGEPAWNFAESARHVDVRLERPVPFGRRMAALKSSVTGVFFLNPGEIVASSGDGRLTVWNSESGEVLRQSLETGGQGGDMRIDSIRRDGGWILTREANSRVVYAADLSPVGSLPLPAGESHRDFALLEGGKQLFGLAGDSRYGQVVNLWDLSAESVIRSRDFRPLGYVSGVASGGKPPRLAAAMFDDRVREVGRNANWKVRYSPRVSLLDPDTLEEIHTVPSEMWEHCSISEDGSRLFAINRLGSHQCWNLPALDPLVTIAGQASVRSSSSSDDGRVLATLSSTGAIQVWDVDRARLLRWWTTEGGLPTSLGLSPDGRKLAIGSDDQHLWIADIPAPGHGTDPDADLGEMTDSIGLRLIRIPAGRFRMGSLDPSRYEGNGKAIDPSQMPERAVTITRPFRMAACEVTVGQFRKFVEATGYRTTAEVSGRGGRHHIVGSNRPRFDTSLTWKSPGFEQGDDHPVVHVSYIDAVAFCEWISKVEGTKYRLPTEAEWEYACRGGTETLRPTGNFTGMLARTGNIADLTYKKATTFDVDVDWEDGYVYTSPVGKLLPNGFGLYDTLGNVWEWCSDHYDPAYYTYGPAIDPPGPSSGTTHTVRGTGYESSVWIAHSPHRDHDKPDHAQSSLGFRVVREIP